LGDRIVQECVASFDRTAVNNGDRADVVIGCEGSFEEYVAAVSGRLFTMALLLSGQHRAEAEDLLQDVLERAYRRWGKITRNGDPDAYVRQMMINAAVDRWRRTRRRPEEPLPVETADIAGRDQVRDIADRDQLLRVLAELPPRQRAVLVLRYFEDLTEAQTAAILGCTVGAVKSQASRALARLRQITPPPGNANPDRSTRKHG
jgi:RNA polymerase sigma-70 factor (sigma-E family)